MADAGWYPDPENPAALRWFDGIQWTEHRQAAPAPQPQYQQPQYQQPQYQQPQYQQPQYQQPQHQQPGYGAPPPSFGAPPPARAAATVVNPMLLLLASAGAALAYFLVGTAGGDSIPGWDGFEETAFAVGGLLQGGLVGLAVGLASPGERQKVVGLSAGLGAAAGVVLGYLQVTMFETLEPDGPGLTLILPIVLLGAAIGAGVGFGAGGTNGLIGGAGAGAAGYFLASALSGGLSADVTTLSLPLLGLAFEVDEAKNLGGCLLAMGPIGLGVGLLTAKR
jgi:hypothetical protein